MDRARELQQARRIEAATNFRAVEHITECSQCCYHFIEAPGHDQPCGAYELLLDQADVAADRVDALRDDQPEPAGSHSKGVN